MVLSRNDKRKRKEGDLVDLMDPLAEPPKKTKIQAQRKFAQGAVTPTYSPVTTPVKEKEKVKPAVFTELITHKRPNTEDFLTFLCFRGTSILPPSLNFFSTSPKKAKANHGAKSTLSKANGVCGKATQVKSDNPSATSSQKQAKEKPANPAKKQPANPKVLKLKTTNPAIQALKKKYQEQRLARENKLKKKFKPTNIKTRSCPEPPLPPDKPAAATTAKAAKKVTPAVDSSRRRGLRSTGLLESEKKSLPMRPVKKQLQPAAKLQKKRTKKLAIDETSSVESFLPAKRKPQPKVLANKLMHKKLVEKSKKTLQTRRVTRGSRVEDVQPQTPARRPTRKTKEAAAVYMEILGRKLVSPDLENDDNMSLDSFPELPNARKIAQTENEIKAKVKSLRGAQAAAAKEKDKKATNNASNAKTVKKKVTKAVPACLKRKRPVKVQKYAESSSEIEESDTTESDESCSDEYDSGSEEIVKKIPVATRRSFVKAKKPENRKLRSTRSLVDKLPTPKRNATKAQSIGESTKASGKSTESTSTAKASKEAAKDKDSPKETPKEKPVPAAKRKRDSAVQPSKDKDTPASKASRAEAPKAKTTEPIADDSASLQKSKKRKDNNEKEEAAAPAKPKPNIVETLKTLETAKTSDDDESFRGFAKRPILDDILLDCKANVLKASGGAYPLIKSDTAVAAAAAAAVKLEPDFGELKVSSTTPSSHNIIDMPRGLNHHGRKERVNMSTEQIEKWLSESSLAKEESKVEMDKYIPPPPPPTSHVGHLSISPKIQHLVRPVNVTLSKLSDRMKNRLPTPIVTKISTTLFPPAKLSKEKEPEDKAKDKEVTKERGEKKIADEKKDEAGNAAAALSRKLSKDSSFGDDTVDSDAVSKSDATSVCDSTTEKKSLASSSSPEKNRVFFQQGRNKQVPFLPKVRDRGKPPASSAFSPENESSVYAFETDEAETSPVSTPFFRRKARDNVSSGAATKHDSGAADKEKNANKVSDSNKQSEADQQQNKQSHEHLNSSVEARKDDKEKDEEEAAAAAAAITTISAGAAAAEEKVVGKSTIPLSERASATTTPKSFELPKNFADLTNVQVLPLDKLTTSWSNVNYSASIAVQINLDEQKQLQQQQQTQQQQQQQQQPSSSSSSSVQQQEGGEAESSGSHKSTEISTQTDANADNDDDDSGQLFYIPLQAVTRNTSAQGGQQLIQGVAVKLGTEGPTGPNQRVLLKAKLVTKPPISVARCPPIGTVQPTARTPQNAEQNDAPSTSNVMSSTAPPDIKATETLEKETKIPSVASKQIHKSPSAEKHVKSSKVKERRGSIDNAKSGKKTQPKKPVEVVLPINNTKFPKTRESNEEARLVDAPVFRPTEKEFQDPLEYIDKIRPIAEKFGICKVVPPSNFKPECKVSDDMRFTAYNHYVHRMLNRWGPNVKELMAIRKYLATQSISLTQPPWVGGMEVDLPHLYQTVQNLGGLKEVIEKKRWQKVADGMKIPRSAQDRVTKLDDIYCKYLLPYDTLSQDERDKLFKDVEADWAKREKRDRQDSQSTDTEDDDEEDITEEIEECIVKGRNMPLNAFYRIARNTQRMWFGDNQRNETEGASADEVEVAFWKHVVEKKRHVCVHAASIDSGGRGFGFSVAKNSPFARHPWNLKILTNNAGSVLRALGPQMGVTVPTLHVGMLFSACCWYRDPHGLPWIEYLHTGAKKIWYGIPNEQNNAFRKAVTKMFPRYCKNKIIWLPSDTAMVPPDMLVANGVPLCQTVQEPGQFIVVFPKAFTSSICTGYVVSESVYFAQPLWLETAEQVFRDIHDSCEPSIFSFERLLFSIINDTRSHIDVLKQILPTVIKVCNKEIENRKKLKELGLMNTEKLSLPENEKKGKNKKMMEDEGDYECDTCRANLFVSLVSNPGEESIFCLTHGIQYIEKKKQVLKNCTLMYTYSESELNDLIHKLKNRIEAKSKKTNQTKAR